MMLRQMEPDFDENEAEALSEYARSGGWFTEHEKTRELEKAIAAFIAVRHCVMVPNCTLALYAALKCLGVGAGDEVIVPAFTMIATANAVRMTGAKPVFADICRNTLCLNPDDVCSLIHDDLSERRIKAVVQVDINGRSPGEEIYRIAPHTFRHITLIEDAAQAFGSRFKSKNRSGFLGKELCAAGVYSFGPLKTISTGQGGCVVTDDDGLAERLRMYKTFGRKNEGCDAYEIFGMNLRFTDLQAVVGLEQMKKLPGRLERKRQIYALYREMLSGTEQVEFTPTDLAWTVPWFVDVLIEDRDGLLRYLKEQRIGARPFYPALHRTPIYGDCGNFPVAEEVSRRGLWLPSASTLTDAEIELVCGVVKDFYRGRRRH